MGYHFKSVEMELNASPVAGLEGYMNIDSLVAGGMQLDTIRAMVHTQEIPSAILPVFRTTVIIRSMCSGHW